AALPGRRAGQAVSSCGSPLNLKPLSEGAHSLVTTARDGAGNASSKTVNWKVDTLAPKTSITHGPPAVSNLPTTRFRFTSSEPGSTFQCKLDGGSFQSCSSPRALSGLS